MAEFFDTRQAQVPRSDLEARILLVDDKPANLLSLRAVLDGLGQTLVDARSGEEALQRVQADEFAVILLDVLMPGMSGFEAASLIRGAERSRHTPIIFLTAGDIDRRQFEEGYALGAVDFLVKPIMPVVIRAKVRGFVELFAEKQRVKQEAEQLRLIVDSAKDYAIFRLDPQGCVASWNPGAERIKQYRADEIIGQHFSRFYPQEAIDRGWPAHELKVAQAEGRFEDEGWRVRKDGSQFWATVVITALRDERGRLRGFSKITRDITERMRAEENARRLVEESTARRVAEEAEARVREGEQRFSRFMQHLAGLAWIKDLQGRYVYINDAAERAFRMPRTELYGKTDDEIFPAQTAAQFKENDQRALASATGVQVIEMLADADGIVHYSLVSKFPILGHDDKAALVGGMAFDITEHRRAEEQNARLYAELQEADRRKDEFLATLAHELRNPLAPIRNSLQILKMSRVDAATAVQTREMMERQVHHLVRLVDDLLDVSRVMRGKIELRKEAVELATVVARAVETAKPLIELQSHELDLSIPSESLLLDADPVRLAQVIGNLLTNSAKYSEPKGHIWLTACREGKQAVLTVRDAGIGIAPDMLPHIFELFVQADHASTKAQGGLGIGLTLAKNLVEMHNGSVEAKSEGLGRGAEFVVRLPLATLAQEEPLGAAGDETHEQPALASGHRLLVVDDNRDAAISLAMLLQLYGHDVRVAHDGPTAIQLARSCRPHAIFLDIGMPGMDGYEVARQIRQTPGLDATVLTALTGWGQAEDRRRSAAAGFDHHLVKPPESKAITDILEGLTS